MQAHPSAMTCRCQSAARRRGRRRRWHPCPWTLPWTMRSSWKRYPPPSFPPYYGVKSYLGCARADGELHNAPSSRGGGLSSPSFSRSPQQPGATLLSRSQSTPYFQTIHAILDEEWNDPIIFHGCNGRPARWYRNKRTSPVQSHIAVASGGGPTETPANSMQAKRILLENQRVAKDARLEAGLNQKAAYAHRGPGVSQYSLL